MATKTKELRLTVIGTDKSGSKALRDVGESGEKMGKDVKEGAEKAKKAIKDIDDEARGLSVSFRESGREAGTALSDGFGTALGIGMAAAGEVALDAFAEMLGSEAATDRLTAQLGGGQWAEEIGGIAGELYGQGFGDSITDAADAIRMSWQGGILPEDATNAQIESMTARLMTFTDVMGQDIDMTTQAISNMIRSGIAENAEDALNTMTAGIQQGADRAGDLAETFQEYSIQFAQLGLTGQEATGLMVQGMAAGARDGDKIADAMKEFAIRAQDGSDLTRESFEALGMSAEDSMEAVAAGGAPARDVLAQVLDRLREMPNSVDKTTASVGLFGTQTEDMAAAMNALDLDTAAARLGDTAGRVDDLGSAYDNAASKIESFKRQALQKVSLFISDTVIPKLIELSDWAKDNPGAFQFIAAVIGGIVVAAFVAWTISATSAAIATLGLTWPIVGIIAILVALAGAILWAYENVDWFRTAVDFLADVFTEVLWPALKAVWHFLQDNLIPIIKNVGRVLLALATGGMSEVVMWIIRNWDRIVAFMKDIPGKIGRATVAIWEWVKTRFRDAYAWVKNKWNDVVVWVGGLPGRVSRAASGMWDGIKNAFKSAINGIIRLWNGLRFPSVTVGGGDPLGSFGPSLPEVTIGGWNLPNIPELGAGGIVMPRAGGVLANLAERGKPEAIIPLDHADGWGGDTYVTIDMRGSIIADDQQFERMVKDAWNHAARKGSVSINGRRL